MSDTRTVLITGGTAGIGEATAAALAKRRWRVVIVGRDPRRCQLIVDHIRRATQSDAIDYLLADLSSQREVRSLAQVFRERYDALHVLINNAAGLFLNRRNSDDGIELTLAVNHLAPFLLTNSLLDVIRQSEPARIINVSSSGHQLSPGMRQDDLQWRRGLYRGFQAYHQSKLANLLFTYELARRLQGTRVTVNAVHPGFVRTNIGMNNGLFWRIVKRAVNAAAGARALSPAEGARTIVYLATSPEVVGVTGCYFADERQIPSSAASRDEKTARWLWQESESLTRQS